MGMRIKHFRDQPFVSVVEGQYDWPCVAWTGEDCVCELRGQGLGVCDTTGIFYGTDEGTDPKFCARHFYQEVVHGDGRSNYRLRDLAQAESTEDGPGRVT
jgi:hypothetical protein